jgi:hypothetical protein
MFDSLQSIALKHGLLPYDSVSYLGVLGLTVLVGAAADLQRKRFHHTVLPWWNCVPDAFPRACCLKAFTHLRLVESAYPC